MAIWFKQGTMQGRQASLYADGQADVANLDAFTMENHLKAGSDCFIIDTSEVYLLNSEMLWHKI